MTFSWAAMVEMANLRDEIAEHGDGRLAEAIWHSGDLVMARTVANLPADTLEVLVTEWRKRLGGAA